jgi:ornithine carbamoyltransferase
MPHFLSFAEVPASELHRLVERAALMKAQGLRPPHLAGKTVALIFEKHSTRTRVSFEVAVRHLGGSTVFLTPVDSQLGRSEPLCDTARVLSRYVDALVVRTFAQANLEELARFGSIPVINALSDLLHPCQVLGDVLTMYERTPKLDELVVAWVGDGNNMANSWIEAAAVFGFTLRVATPVGFAPDAGVVRFARSRGARLEIGHDPKAAVAGAHYVNTDVWASMGQEAEATVRQQAFAGFQVDEALMALAHPQAKFLHCLPAHRGEEVSAAVFEGPQSIVFDQAENRLHIQKAIVEWAV